MWSTKQRQMIEVYVCLVQRCYREHLARQAALQARLLRVDPKLLLRLHAVWLRRETRAAELLQRSWRATVQTRGGRERLAARRVGHALLHRREEKASSALRAAREREIAELRAVLRLQVAARRLLQRTATRRTARHLAHGLLREQLVRVRVTLTLTLTYPQTLTRSAARAVG